MRITAKGQVTIPADIRQRTGLLPHTDVEFRAEGGAVRIVPARMRRPGSRGQKAVAGLRGSATVKMTTDEILRLTGRAKAGVTVAAVAPARSPTAGPEAAAGVASLARTS